MCREHPATWTHVQQSLAHAFPQFAGDASRGSWFSECSQLNRPIIRERWDCQYFDCWSGHFRCMQIVLPIDRRAKRIFYENWCELSTSRLTRAWPEVLSGWQHGNRCTASLATRMFLSFVNKTKCFLHSGSCVRVDSTNCQATSHLKLFYVAL